MKLFCAVCAAVLALAGGAAADEVRGEYLEARNADVWTGPCFANGEMNIIGNKATMAWKVDRGAYQGVRLDGLAIVAVVFGDNTFGLDKPVRTRTLLIVDAAASETQKAALVALARELAGETIQDVVAVERRPIEMATGYCDGKGCARLDADLVRIATRCLHAGDSICGHEEIYYPVLSRVESPYAAYATVHDFSGRHFNETFSHGNARSAVLGAFSLSSERQVARK